MKRNRKPEPPKQAPQPPPEYPPNRSELERLMPPHFAVLCNEDVAEFNKLFDQYLGIYQPPNQGAFLLVRELVALRWQALRLENIQVNEWNLALLRASAEPLELAPELAELQYVSRATAELLTGPAIGAKLVRIADSVSRRIVRLERHLAFYNRTFGTRVVQPGSTRPPAPPPEPAAPPEAAPPADPTPGAENIENDEVLPTDGAGEQPLYVTEDNANVIAYYRKFFPGRQIVILPPDDVALGIDVEDDFPDLPRKVA